MDKKFMWLGMFVGSTIGGLIPSLWGASMMSFSGLLFSAFGAVLGIYLAFKYTRGI